MWKTIPEESENNSLYFITAQYVISIARIPNLPNMIAYLRGILISKQPGVVILDTGGVGYRVRISNHTFDRLPATDEQVTLRIHHHISDSDQQLFGFAAIEEQNLFELLITVKSIGPRLALALLSAMPPRHIIEAILQQNAALISQSPGIGKKSAERIVLELRDKLGDIAPSDDSTHSAGSLQNETLSALEALGYGRGQAHSAIQNVLKSETPPENVAELLKKALKYLQ